MNRTINDATLTIVFDSDFTNFVDACKYARRLKTLKGLTPLQCHLQSNDEKSGNGSALIHSTTRWD